MRFHLPLTIGLLNRLGKTKTRAVPQATRVFSSFGVSHDLLYHVFLSNVAMEIYHKLNLLSIVHVKPSID